jgi:hypothetical protein
MTGKVRKSANTEGKRQDGRGLISKPKTERNGRISASTLHQYTEQDGHSNYISKEITNTRITSVTVLHILGIHTS